MEIDSMRKTYTRAALDEATVAPDPIDQFRTWFAEAKAAEHPDWYEINAMTVSTCGRDGRVSSRTILLKAVDAEGFTFFTNYQSRKGRHLAENPFASLCFFWPHIERQVRIDGAVEKVSPEMSDKYFQSRPRSSQLGAWVSEQSEVVASRRELETSMQQREVEFADRPVPRPEHWGGYRVLPEVLEFWQGRPNRLHDRIFYQRSSAPNSWTITRLAP